MLVLWMNHGLPQSVREDPPQSTKDLKTVGQEGEGAQTEKQAGSGEGAKQDEEPWTLHPLIPQGLKTGSFFYPGGNVTYQGEAVTMSRKEGVLHNYKNETEWRGNVDTVMKWFLEEDVSLVTLYFGEPDSTGHKYGPESQERKDMVKQVDRTVGYLRDSIKRHHLSDSLNLIITSDHGMTTVNKKASDLVEFHKFSNFTFQDIQFELLDYGPIGMLIPKEGMLEKVYSVLKDAHPRLHVYKKEDFPKNFHYANNPRITPLLMYSDLGYVIHGVSGLLWPVGGPCSI